MTAVLPMSAEVDENTTSATSATSDQYRAGLEAIIETLVNQSAIQRENYGYYPPTPAELDQVRAECRAHWYRVAHVDMPTAGVAE